jgi:hypothetical protein
MHKRGVGINTTFGISMIAASLSLILVGPATADRGVALDLGKLEIAQTLTPGGGYHLPPLGVRNPGDEATSYRIVVTHVQGQEGTPLPEDWLSFEPAKLTLEPGKLQKVRPRLNVPTGADPGDYEGLIAAQIVTEGEGAQVGAAAAARVTFSVESATLLGDVWHRIRSFAADHGPWTWLIPSLLVLTLIAAQTRRRFSLRVERRA